MFFDFVGCSYALKNKEDNDFLVSFHSLNTAVMSGEIFCSKEDERGCLFIYTFFFAFDFSRSWYV